MPHAHDEVDRIVAAWQRERPGLDAAPLEVLSRVSRLARHLDLARREAFAASGLEGWEFDVLAALRRSGPPYRLTPRELTRATLVSSGTMTNRVDRLLSRELVQRVRSEEDGREVPVQLTDRGRELVDAAMDRLLEHERALLAGVSTADQVDLADTLRTLLLHFDGTG
ncbi:MAG TPA: MarR family transcriptional regulator [Ornithinimicrobium sp.]|uniref:MarR family winged helix-turn-helix transcriptional regulator n=1 Tax=Ornithinimicrobium sp. TaxID=1977084 RepID=UPI002B46D802|nr:MarR family transcriptional regulator [Ornithinimicrobium sp.]HKJ12873.1 MarR family transcriptional regulator [Ornithinimicrobium sp.]